MLPSHTRSRSHTVFYLFLYLFTNFIIYLISNLSVCAYIRLRKHNGELAGGAVSTKPYAPWVVYSTVEGFESKSEAMSFEYRVKHPHGPTSFSSGPIDIRVRVAETMIRMVPAWEHLRVVYHLE